MRTVKVRTVKDTATPALNRLKNAMSPRNQDLIVKRTAYKTLSAVVSETPVGFSGNTRKAWGAQQMAPAHWKVRINPANTLAMKVMGFLEDGTKAHGPVKAKFLYIPLNANASLGYRWGLVHGKDYVLAKWVMGITALRIVARARENAKAWMKQFMVEHLRKALKGVGV
jgi:hypothetical protein